MLLKLYFSFSKKIIFFSPILANNNIPLKIYCENIVIIFHSSFFLFFPLFFYPPHTAFLSFFFPFFFPSFFLLHTRTRSLFFLILLSSFFFPAIPPNSRTFRALLLRLFFFFFLALCLLVLGGVVDAWLWERGPLLGKEAFGSVFLAKPTSKFLSFPSLMAVKSADQCCLVFCWSNLYLQNVFLRSDYTEVKLKKKKKTRSMRVEEDERKKKERKKIQPIQRENW